VGRLKKWKTGNTARKKRNNRKTKEKGIGKGKGEGGGEDAPFCVCGAYGGLRPTALSSAIEPNWPAGF
jgi:hypothetical protein